MSAQVKFVLSANFKVLRKGDFVKPSEAGGEFLYVAGNGKDDFTVAQLEEIAKSNKLKVHGKNKTELKHKLDEELINMKNVPEQNGPTQSEIVEDIIRKGVEENKSDDDMLIEIITAGVTFRQAGKIFKETMERLGLRASIKAVKETASAVLEEMDFSPKTYDDVEKAIKKIMAEVEGAEKKQAMVAIRSFCKENEIEMPKKPKGRRGAVGFRGQVFDWILNNPEGTVEDLQKFAEEHGKPGEKIGKQFAPIIDLCRQYAEKHG